MSGPALRPVGGAHAPVLAALHALCFGDGSVTGPPWPEKAFADLLALPGCFGLLALDGEVPVGLVLVQVAVDEAEILTIGTHPHRRRLGIGRHLMQAALAEAAVRGATRMILEVAETNLPASQLYAWLGFADVGRRRAYYRLPGGAVDARILARTLT